MRWDEPDVQEGSAKLQGEEPELTGLLQKGRAGATLPVWSIRDSQES